MLRFPRFLHLIKLQRYNGYLWTSSGLGPFELARQELAGGVAVAQQQNIQPLQAEEAK